VPTGWRHGAATRGRRGSRGDESVHRVRGHLPLRERERVWRRLAHLRRCGDRLLGHVDPDREPGIHRRRLARTADRDQRWDRHLPPVRQGPGCETLRYRRRPGRSGHHVQVAGRPLRRATVHLADRPHRKGEPAGRRDGLLLRLRPAAVRRRRDGEGLLRLQGPGAVLRRDARALRQEGRHVRHRGSLELRHQLGAAGADARGRRDQARARSPRGLGGTATRSSSRRPTTFPATPSS